MQISDPPVQGRISRTQGGTVFIPILTVFCFMFGLADTLADTVVTFNVPATAQWVNTGLRVTSGQLIDVTATGQWTDGNTTSGPDGATKLWSDNFFNTQELGVCSTCAMQATPGWGALIGYIGNSPPAPGSYTSASILPEALKTFY